MKKIMIFAAMAAMFSLVSCQKDEVVANNESKVSPVFTASINAGTTKTTVDVSTGKVTWESTDKITITDASAASAIYKVKSIDGNTGKVANMKEIKVFDTLAVRKQTLKTAIESTCMLLRIDDIVSGIKKKEKSQPSPQAAPQEQPETFGDARDG